MIRLTFKEYFRRTKLLCTHGLCGDKPGEERHCLLRERMKRKNKKCLPGLCPFLFLTEPDGFRKIVPYSASVIFGVKTKS